MRLNQNTKNQYTIPGTRAGKFLTRNTPAVREQAFSGHVQCKKYFKEKIRMNFMNAKLPDFKRLSDVNFQHLCLSKSSTDLLSHITM